MNINKKLDEFKEEAFKKYTDKDFVKDIESIFIAYEKKEVKKIGLLSLVKQIRINCLDKVRKELLIVLGEDKPAQQVANQLVGFIYDGIDKVKGEKK